jgi:hypothetical protein
VQPTQPRVIHGRLNKNSHELDFLIPQLLLYLPSVRTMTEISDSDSSLTPKTSSVHDAQDCELGMLGLDEVPEGGWQAWSCVAGAYVKFNTLLNASADVYMSSLALIPGSVSKWLALGMSHLTRSYI